MLKIVKRLADLDFGQLMEVYREGNLENGQELWPELPEGQQIFRAEQDFYQFLREIFFKKPGAYYALWVVDGRYVSALRMESFRDGFLLEALETVPEQRRKGYACALMAGVLANCEPGKIYSHVKKTNASSLFVHEKCGFQRISQQAVYIDGSADSRSYTLCFEK